MVIIKFLTRNKTGIVSHNTLDLLHVLLPKYASTLLWAYAVPSIIVNILLLFIWSSMTELLCLLGLNVDFGFLRYDTWRLILTQTTFDPRWGTQINGNMMLGEQVLNARGLNFDNHFYLVVFGTLIGFSLFFNVVYVLALTFLKAPQRSRHIISDKDSTPKSETITHSKRRVVLPFEPLSVTFQGVQYYVDAPSEMRKKGLQQKKLQLLSDITGAFRPGVLTALMGASGAGKTTLLDVLSGRKTGGTIEGEIRVGGYLKVQETFARVSGYLKVQETFARVSGYCEQFDVHSPNLTVEESLMYSAFLRLPSDIDSKTKKDIVNEVLDTIELEEIKDSIVGIAGKNGLSTEQRKRLTIAVELVANPSIIFLDEPTTGLDARAAAIVMRAVKNIVNTGRTIVCTIHQPSIDIFEAFDELILMKTGGKLIYHGAIGQNSKKVIEYFDVHLSLCTEMVSDRWNVLVITIMMYCRTYLESQRSKTTIIHRLGC